MTVAHVDFETRSAVDLRKTGAYVYAADPTTDIWCMAWAIGDDPVQVWVPGDEMPGELVEHIMLGGVVVAHNAAFERVIWHYILSPRYGFPKPEVAQWRDTMVMAYAMGLPGSLEMAAPAAGIEIAKDMVGRRLMLQMAKPRKVEKDGTIIWWDQPEKIQRLIDYCKIDVEVERQLEKRLRPLKKSELALWHLDQLVNDRGVLVDTDLANAAKEIVAKAADSLDKRMGAITNYNVTACSNRNQIMTYLGDLGVSADSIKKDILEELIASDLEAHIKATDEADAKSGDPDRQFAAMERRGTPAERAKVAREVLILRSEAAKASVAKIDALLRGASPEDSRAKGLLQFHAAGTGRWGGRRFQPQNLRRPEESDIDTLIDVVATGDFDYVKMMFGEPLSAVADILRGLIVAAPDHRIIAADYSNIEGRVLAWLAGESWKMDAFREFDAGRGHDLYKLTAGSILGKKSEDITKDERQSYGKVPELACGYQGGYGAFVTMGANYGVDLPEDRVREIVTGWREAHPNVKQFWYDMESAAVAAVQDPGTTHWCGKIRFKKTGSFLAMRLPSGRHLFYPYPEVRSFEVPWTNKDGSQAYKDGLTYFTTIDVSKKAKMVDDPGNTSSWARIKTYGGMLAENATQAAARDILADAMPRLEAAGYPIILTVHDEVVCEVPNGHGSVEEMERIMCELPEWAAGLPVAAEGFEGERYRK